MTLQELRTKANAKLATLWPIIQAKEDAYFVKHGQYFGLRWSPTIAVVDGVDTNLTLSFPSRGISQADVTFDPTDVPFQIMIERVNQVKPNDVSVWSDLRQPKPEPVWGPTSETYKATVRIELLNGDVWVRERLQDNTDSNWYQPAQMP